MDLTDIFSKCKEMYEAKLNEDLGTLKVIDPKFLNLFKQSYSRHQNHPKLGGDNRAGQSSPVNAVDTVTARQASDMFFGEGSKYLGMILRANGEQVLAFSRSEKNYKGNPEVRGLLDNKAYSAIEKDTARYKKVEKPFYSLTGQTSDQSLSYSEAKTVLNNVFKAFKEAGVKLDALVIGADVERAQKQAVRKAARYGAEKPVKTNQNYKEDAKNSLRARLEKFKASRAQQYDTPEQFMAGAIKEGFLDKVNIGGFNYNLSDDQLRLRDISKPSGWHKSNAITYRIDTQHSLKLEELSEQLWNLRKELKDHPNQEEVEAKLEGLKSKFPPDEFKIIMGMSGGTIVPQSIEASERKASY